jgi:hypothetical protein
MWTERDENGVEVYTEYAMTVMAMLSDEVEEFNSETPEEFVKRCQDNAPDVAYTIPF